MSDWRNGPVRRDANTERIEVLEAEVTALREQLQITGEALASRVAAVKALEETNASLLERLHSKHVAP